MPRKTLIRSDRFPYHVTARANNKESFSLDLRKVWEIATNELYLLTNLYEIEIHAFVLMPNHLHLLITIPSQDLGKIMSIFLSNLTKRINFMSSRSGHVFGGPYFWSLIGSTRYFGHVLKYVYRNPVKAKLCNFIEEYEFSTGSGIFGNTNLPFPIYLTRLGLEINLPDIQNPDSWKNWLNKPFPGETEKLIQKCLRKREINILLRRGSRLAYRELDVLI